MLVISCVGWLLVSPTRIGFFYASFRSETPVLNPRVVGLFIWRRNPQLFAGFSKHCVSSFWIRIFFTTIELAAFINTFTMCHSTRSRRRRRAATPATMPTRPTWMWRGRRRTTTPSRPTRMRWTRTRPSSRRGPPLLQNPDASLVPWYATPLRLNIPLLLD
jgi:hypothetical protein